MKKVIFVCLLTLSVCLSQHAEQSSQAGSTTADPKPTDKAKGVTPSQSTQGGAQTATPVPSTPGQTPVTSPPSSTTPSTALPTAPIPVTVANETKTPTIAPTPEVSGKNATNETVTTSTTLTPPTPSPKPDGHKPTSEAPVPKPEAPTPKTIVQARGFDGASFVGGIILTLGLIAIGFMGLKYYRAQTERNYHTL